MYTSSEEQGSANVDVMAHLPPLENTYVKPGVLFIYVTVLNLQCLFLSISR